MAAKAKKQVVPVEISVGGPEVVKFDIVIPGTASHAKFILDQVFTALGSGRNIMFKGSLNEDTLSYQVQMLGLQEGSLTSRAV